MILEDQDIETQINIFSHDMIFHTSKVDFRNERFLCLILYTLEQASCVPPLKNCEDNWDKIN